MAFPVRARERIIAALDVPGPAAAAALAARLAGHVGVYKVGLELFVAHGRAAVDAIRPFGLPIFLDLKLHDIPQTVEAAARGAGTLGAALVTVHASGGTAMIAAARSGLSAGAQKAGVPTPKLLAVTVLTSLAPDDLHALGFSGSPAQTALRLAYPNRLRMGEAMELRNPRLIDSSPFYLRLIYDATCRGKQGSAFCEVAYPHRLRWPILGRMIEMSIGR